MKRFPRGSEWRKWDLHVHTPGTKLNDSYTPKNGQPHWERFCKVIHDSEVQAIGIADYFSLDGFFAFKENYYRLYPGSEKVFFPNLELRLNETVNRATELVDFHVIFRPDLTREQANEFLRELKTQITDTNDRKLACAELVSERHFESASVSRDDLKDAVRKFCGQKAVVTDYLLFIAAANNNGIRPDTGNQRKMVLSDEIDKVADGFFGNPVNVSYFLNPDRLEAPGQRALPKPVFAGCDAHKSEDLEAWLGAEVAGANGKHPTWIKADLTFEGLQQTLVEPAERVRIQAVAPDKKEPYKVISRITFTDSDKFPPEIVFNPGLNAIIGSRSSGKSALLAYVAHAVDPEHTVQQQVAATGMSEREVGPGASFTWNDVSGMKYAVEWASPSATTGKVIYIPQNSLYAISERPSDITAKIQPVVFRNDPDFKGFFGRTKADVEKRNESIRTAVSQWFARAGEIQTLADEIRSLGDREAISNRQLELSEQIKTLRESSALTAEEVERYQQVVGDIARKEALLKEIEQQQHGISPYVKPDTQAQAYQVTESVTVAVTMTPAPATLPRVLQAKLEPILEEARGPVLERVKFEFLTYRAALEQEQMELTAKIEALRSDNKELIEKNLANTQIAALVQDLKSQEDKLAEFEKKTALLQTKMETQRTLLASIVDDIKKRDESLAALRSSFNNADHTLEELKFTMEIDLDPADVERASGGFNKRETSPYIINHERVDLKKILEDPGAFIEHMDSGKQKLNQGVNIVAQTSAILTMTLEVRFVAWLEGDRIGGFATSSMTPGKQAMFALTLILAESVEPWPLLIDQPEDDLDSRSICDVIVKDLMKRKCERQVIIVSHNANLVIGADSEEVIVANRHGDDRPNRDGKTFAYLTGSLEFSKQKDPNQKFVLESAGIREHACEILDGGAEAFQKRKNKYRI